MTFRSGFAALVGRPNVGKSTLLNALVGEKVAIVSPRPQTTRRRLLGIRTTEAAQVVFVDTPGVHEPRHLLGRTMVAAAVRAILDADVVLFVVDASSPPTADDERLAGSMRGSQRPVLLVLNKADLAGRERRERHENAYRELVPVAASVATVATTGHNLDLLWQLIVDRMPPGPPYYPADQITDQTERLFAAELIREAALRHLRDEVPHGVEAFIEEWVERPNGVLYIAAQLLVERESHKGMVIGSGGAMLRRIGSEARHAIEAQLGHRVYLELTVVVRRDWRKKPGELRRLGFR